MRRLLYEMTHFGAEWSEEYFNDHDEFLVKHVERRVIEHLLHDREKVLVDNTSVSLSSRENYVKIAQKMKATIGVIFLNTTRKKCLERNMGREDSIPETVIANLAAGLDLPRREEGFKEVLVVNDY